MSSVAAPTTAERSSKIGPLEREMANAHRRLVEDYSDHYGLTPDEAAARAEETASAACDRQLLDGDSRELTWNELQSLSQRDPALQERCWQEMKQSAADELQSGHRAAEAVETSSIRPWERAQFLALRDSLAKDWEPQTGIERLLIDTLAQAYTAQLMWQQRVTLWSTLEPESDHRTIKESGEWKRPRVDVTAAIDEAAKMVDRYNRMVLRTLRALRDLRRYAPSIVVQNAGQVNVGERQVNVVAEGG